MSLQQQLTVLIVEDETLVRDELVLTTPWETFGCTVIGQAEDGIVGAELIRTLSPDIVITDIRMPGKDGISMLTEIMPAAAIILTGHSDFSYARQALRLGVKDYILKPVDDRELYAAIDRICRSLRDERIHMVRTNEERAVDTEDLIDGDRQDHYITTACSYMLNHCGEDIALADAASAAGITQSYLSRLFRRRTGRSFVEYLRDIRIERAKELMADKSLRVNEIARQVGFRDMSYFSIQFRRCVGVSPSAYVRGERDQYQKREGSAPLVQASDQKVEGV